MGASLGSSPEDRRNEGNIGCSVIVIGGGALLAAGAVVIGGFHEARAQAPQPGVEFTCIGERPYQVGSSDTLTHVLDAEVEGVDGSNRTRITKGFSLEGRDYDGSVDVPAGIIAANNLGLTVGETISIPVSCEPGQ